MRIVLVILLVIALLIPGAAIAQDALPYLDVSAAPCQFNFNFQVYGTIWNFTSLGQEKQRIVMYASYPDGLEKMYDQTIQSGESRYIEEWNFVEPPTEYLVQTFDQYNFTTGEQWYKVPHCTRKLWIPKVEGAYVAS